MRLIETWEAELRDEPEGRRKLQMYRRVEQYLDRGHGSCVLRNPAAARVVQALLIEKHGELFDLHEWVVMPNHVHVLLTPGENEELGELVGYLKGRSSHDVNQLLGRCGPLWQPDYFDRIMRDERHFQGTAYYIRRNPVKAKLCQDATLWAASSANPVAQERLRIRTRGLKPADRGAP